MNQTYPVDVAVSYTNREGTIVTSSSETMGVPVNAKTIFSVISPVPEIPRGISGSIEIQYRNDGNVTIYNAQARITPHSPITITDNSAFLGDLEPGMTARARYVIQADAAAEAMAYTFDSNIRYRDARGNSLTSDTLPVKIVVVPAAAGPSTPEMAFRILAGCIIAGIIIWIAVRIYRLKNNKPVRVTMIQQIFEGIANTIIKKPKLVAGLVIAIFCIGLFGMTMLSMQTGWETYMNKDSPGGILQTKYDEDYKADSIILIVEAADPLSPEVLKYIDNLEKNLVEQQNIKSAVSIVDVLKSANGGTLPASRADTDRIVSSLPENIRKQVSPSNVLTLVQIKLAPGLSEKVQKSVLTNVASIISNSNAPPGVTVELSGSPAFNQQMSAGLTSNMGILIGGCHDPDDHIDGDPLCLCPLPVYAGPACSTWPGNLTWPDGSCRYPAEHGSNRGLPGPDRSWD